MRKIIFPIKFLLLALIFFSQLTLPISNRAFSQTTPETAAEQWSLRQTEIEQFYQEGDLQGALNIAQEAVSLAETAFGPASLETISSLLMQAQIHSELDQLEEANQIYQTAIETTVSTFGESDATTLSVLDSYGQFLNSIDPEMAEPILTEALRLSENEDPQRAARMKALGQNFQEIGRISEAEEMLNEALKVFQTLVGEKDTETLSAMAVLAQLHLSQGKLKPAQEGGSVTAAMASGVTDGAGAFVLTSREKAAAAGLSPLSSLVSYAQIGLDPADMLEGPAFAIPMVLEKAGLTLGDIDLIEVNEAFASQILANELELGWDRSRLNIHGGAIALGHPTGFTGVRLMVSLSYALRTHGGTYGLIAICGGGGLGVAMIIRNESANPND